MTITLNSMRDNLISFEDIIKRLEVTEPMDAVLMDSTSSTKFNLPAGWAEQAKESGMTEAVSATVTSNGKEFQFTKEGILQATSLIGLKAAYVLKTPPKYIEDQLNYWFNSGLEDSVRKMVTVKGLASAFVAPTITSFSNIELAQSIYDGIQDHHGNGTEVLGDYKFQNSLNKTDVRFIVPSSLKVIHDSNMVDVPSGKPDVWSTGINLTNSLIGKGKTSIDSYLFRWWCTNGAIRVMDDIGTWNRKVSGQSEEAVYEWAANAVDEVLGGMETAFERVQALVHIKPGGNTADVLTKIFSEHKIPINLRESITNDVISANSIHMYAVMNAITSQANDTTIPAEKIDLLMRAGGALPESYFDDSKKKIFRQGQIAGPDAPNPYEMVGVE